MAEAAADPSRRPLGTRVLVAAASRHGATAGIAQAIGQVLSEQGLTVAVIPPEDVGSLDGYGAVIIGSAVYMGHWLDPAKDLVNRFHAALADRPVWLFSSGPIGKPSGKLAQSMDQDPVDLPGITEASRAREHRRFAGKLDRKCLSLPRRASLLVFRGLNGDFRDWVGIRQWAEGIARQLALAPRCRRQSDGAAGHPPPRSETGRRRQDGERRILATAFGIGAGLLGLEHGFFETQQGSAKPGGLVIHAIGPPCQPHAAWHGCEPALSVIPSFRATGIAARNERSEHAVVRHGQH